MIFKKTLLCLLAFVFVQNVFAYDLSKKFGFGLTGGYSVPVFGNPFNSQADADFGYAVHGRYHFNEAYNLELAVGRSEFSDTRIRLDNFNLIGVWRVFDSNQWTPILGAGLGLTRVRNFGPKSMKLSGLARVGVEYGVSPWFSVGLLADYQYVSKLLGDMPTTRAHILTPQLALTWYFGGESSKAAAPVNEVQVAQSTQTTKSNIVDDSNLDSDDDGVKDPEDRCPLTKVGTKVNAIGCAMDEKATMQINVEFDSGKSAIDSKFNSHLDEVSDFLKKYSEVKVQIQGYTDNQGSVAKNVALSDARAKSVMKSLVDRGISLDRISAKGFGPADPVADNGTREGRQANRRVVAVISSK